MKVIQLSDDELRIIRTRVIPELENMPGHPGFMDGDDELLWSFIDKLKGASDD